MKRLKHPFKILCDIITINIYGRNDISDKNQHPHNRDSNCGRNGEDHEEINNRAHNSVGVMLTPRIQEMDSYHYQ